MIGGGYQKHLYISIDNKCTYLGNCSIKFKYITIFSRYMDDIDKEILNIIQNDATISYQKIGTKLGVGTSTIHYRIEKMKKQGIITSISAMINPEKIGFDATAVIGLNVEPLQMDEIAEHILKFDEVQTVATSSGDHDLIIQIIAENGKEIWRFINTHIKTIQGVDKKIHVSLFLDVYKRTPKIVL